MNKFFSIFFVFIALAITACDKNDHSENTQNVGWDLNDVSILYPVNATSYPMLLGLTQPTNKGNIVLMDRELFGFLGTRATPLVQSNELRQYDSLKITALRIDPCNDGLVNKSAPCLPVVRVVAQPIVPLGNGRLKVYDASIHLFYSLTTSEFNSFVAEYNLLRGQRTTGPLHIHPILAQENLSGRFSNGLSSLIVNYLHSSKIIKFTYMATNAAGTSWTWGGFARNSISEPFKDIQIPHLNSNVDHLELVTRASVPQGLGFDTRLFPDSFLWDPSIQNVPNQNVLQKVRQIQLIEDPIKRNADNVNCSSCHKANVKHYALQIKGIREPLESAWAPRGNYNTQSLYAPSRSEDGKNFHAFSYFGLTPTVSQRVINDSAVVADYLNGLRD